jgi:hypothetical protein
MKNLIVAIATVLLCAEIAEAQRQPGGGGGGGTRVSAPEFDRKSAGAVVALVVGACLVVLGARRRSKRSKSLQP